MDPLVWFYYQTRARTRKQDRKQRRTEVTQQASERRVALHSKDVKIVLNYDKVQNQYFPHSLAGTL